MDSFRSFSRSRRGGRLRSSSGGVERRTPASASALGLLGLAPLVAAAGVYTLGPPSLAGPALLTLLAYSAAILSFLGGTRWGMEVATHRPPRWGTLALSNLPALSAWLLLAGTGGFGLSERQALGGFLLAFIAQGAWDARAEDAPIWHRRLRVVLTLGVCLSLAVGLGSTLRG